MPFENIKKETAKEVAQREALREVLKRSPYYDKLSSQEAEKLISQIVEIIKNGDNQPAI